MPATVLNGRFSKITYGTTQILGAGKFSISGLTRRVVVGICLGMNTPVQPVLLCCCQFCCWQLSLQ